MPAPMLEPKSVPTQHRLSGNIVLRCGVAGRNLNEAAHCWHGILDFDNIQFSRHYYIEYKLLMQNGDSLLLLRNKLHHTPVSVPDLVPCRKCHQCMSSPTLLTK